MAAMWLPKLYETGCSAKLDEMLEPIQMVGLQVLGHWMNMYGCVNQWQTGLD